MTNQATASPADRGVMAEVDCTVCDWTQPPGYNPDHGTRERPGCADYVDAVMPLVSEHIDGTGHPVRITLTSFWADRDNEVSATVLRPRPVAARDAA